MKKRNRKRLFLRCIADILFMKLLQTKDIRMNVVTSAFIAIFDFIIGASCDGLLSKVSLNMLSIATNILVMALNIAATCAPNTTDHIPSLSNSLAPIAWTLCVFSMAMIIESVSVGICVWNGILMPLSLFPISPTVACLLFLVSCIGAAFRHVDHASDMTFSAWVASFIMSPYFLLQQSLSARS